MPQKITDTILVAWTFKDRNGTEYVPGDRVPIRHRWVRRLAAAQPESFRMEFETVELDLEWLAGLEADFEEKYQAVKRDREGAKDRQERALRDELKEQERPQPELERLFAKQEAERKARDAEALEEREREGLEKQIEIVGTDLRVGFNY